MSRTFKVLIFVSTLFIGWILIAPLLANFIIVEKPLEKADAILVLSGSAVFKERTHKAAQIYKSGVSQKVLLSDDGGYSGWSEKEQRNPPFVYLAQQELISQGVAEEDIEILDKQVTGTIWEARNLDTKLKQENWQKVLLITSAYHTRRALWTFEDVVGNDVEIGIVASPTGEETPPPWIWWLSQNGWQLVAGEYVKFVVYWLYY